MAKLTKNNAQFTYDFGIAIAQSTVNRVAKLAGVSLTLASAFYALKQSASQYVKTLKENTLRFGGVLSTMKAMEQAQERLIKGQSYFSVEEQLNGMNKLMAVGVDVRENFEWVNKAAHATGRSFDEFSGMIASAIQGNSQALVDAGLMTQRATRMFDKYQANTIMRQQAILNFVKNHKGLMNAIKNDFVTIQDQMNRIKGTWRAFLNAIVGKPNDPNSFYGQIVASLNLVATSLARNAELLKRYGFVIGQTLGWIIKQIGHFVVWVGGQTKKAIESVWKVTDDFQNQTRSMLVWLEFWKLKIVDFFKSYGGEIKAILKLLIAYKAMKTVFVISNAAILSVIRYKKALKGMLVMQKRYLTLMGPEIGTKFGRWLQSLAVFMPRWLRRMWVSVGKFFERMTTGGGFMKFLKGIIPFFKSVVKFIGRAGIFLVRLLKNLPVLLKTAGVALKGLISAFLGSNPIGWIVLAVALLVTLYIKVKSFRDLVNNFFKTILEVLKLIWNMIAYGLTWVLVGLKKVWLWFKKYIWNPIADFFKKVWGWIGIMWDKFMNSAVGRFINKWIVQPLKTLFEWIVDAWHWLVESAKKLLEWVRGANDTMSDKTKALADEYGVAHIPTFRGHTEEKEPEKTPTKEPTINEMVAPNVDDTSNPIADTYTGGSSAPSSVTEMSFQQGAIQIIVQKGEGIDEEKLARKVREAIQDMNRQNSVRGGTL